MIEKLLTSFKYEVQKSHGALPGDKDAETNWLIATYLMRNYLSSNEKSDWELNNCQYAYPSVYKGAIYISVRFVAKKQGRGVYAIVEGDTLNEFDLQKLVESDSAKIINNMQQRGYTHEGTDTKKFAATKIGTHIVIYTQMKFYPSL